MLFKLHFLTDVCLLFIDLFPWSCSERLWPVAAFPRSGTGNWEQWEQEGKGGAIMAVGGQETAPGLEGTQPTHSALSSVELSLLLADPEAFRQTQRPFGRLRSSAISVGPNPSPEAYAFAKMGKGSCG